MKRKYIIIIVVVVIIVVLCIVGIVIALNKDTIFTESKKQSLKIEEVYEQFHNEPQYIEVTMNDEYTGSFSINEKEYIDEIYQIICSQNYVLYKEVLPPGSNKSIKFIFYDDISISLSTRYITYSGCIYLASQSIELDNLLIKIGLEQKAINER